MAKNDQVSEEVLSLVKSLREEFRAFVQAQDAKWKEQDERWEDLDSWREAQDKKWEEQARQWEEAEGYFLSIKEDLTVMEEKLDRVCGTAQTVDETLALHKRSESSHGGVHARFERLEALHGISS